MNNNVEVLDAPTAIETIPLSSAGANKAAAEMEDLKDSMKALAEQENEQQVNEEMKKIPDGNYTDSGQFTLKHYIVSGMTVFFLFTAYSLHRRYKITLFSDRTETKMQEQDIEITSSEEINPFLSN